MTGNARHLSGISRHRFTRRDLLSIDRVDDDGPHRLVKRYGRVSEKRILQFVHRDISIKTAKLDQLVLRLALRLTQGHRRALVGAQHIFQISIVNQPVVVLIHRSRRSIDSHGASVLIGHRCHTDIVCHAIESHDITGSEDPEWQILVCEGFIIIEHQYPLVRQLCGTSMSAIVHDKRALRLLLLDKRCHLRISVTR